MGKILNDELKTFIFGAVDIFEDGDWVCFSRFTEKQSLWLKNNGFQNERYSSSGIRLELITKGGLLSFDYHSEKSTKGDLAIFGLEITIDGLPYYHIYKEELPITDKIKFEIPKHNDAVHVAVYFPLRASIKLKDVILPDDAQPARKDLKILTLGDSITAGAVCRHPNHCYVNLIADNLNAEVVNQGVGGARFFPDFIDVLPFEPDIVTIAYGVNDFGDGVLISKMPKMFFEKIYRIYNEKKVFVLLPIWFGKEEESKVNTFDEGRKYLKELAQKYPNFLVIDCKEFVPHLSEFFWDEANLHPNDLGFLYYGKNLTNQIKTLLNVDNK